MLQLTNPSELRGKFPRREGGGVQDFRRCGVVMGRGGRHTYPKETYNTCNFLGGGGGSRSPDPTSLWTQKSRESVETIDTPKYTVVQQLQVDITNSVMFCSGQNSSIAKDDNFFYAKESYGSL